MNKSSVTHSNHCVYSTSYHLVLVVKYRKPVFTGDMLTFLEEMCRERLCQWDGKLLEFNGEEDHIHLLVSVPPKHSIASLVNAIKTGTSRRLRNTYPDEVKKHFWKGVLWSRSYFVATTGGVTLDVVKEYITNQARPD